MKAISSLVSVLVMVVMSGCVASEADDPADLEASADELRTKNCPSEFGLRLRNVEASDPDVARAFVEGRAEAEYRAAALAEISPRVVDERLIRRRPSSSSSRGSS